jgi:hypothetical protein
MSTMPINQLTLPDREALEAVCTGEAYYTYAIARQRADAPAAAPGIPGIDQRYPVRVVGQGAVVALVSTVSLAEFELSTLEQRLQDRNWLEMLAIGHQRVLTSLLEHYTLLPLKLCTLYTDERRIEALLATGLARFSAELDRLEGSNEWGLKLFCNQAALAEWAAQNAPQLSQQASSVAAASPGARFMLQKRLQRAAQQIAEQLQRSETELIAASLATMTRAAQRGRLQPAQIHGRSDTMTLNGAYLVAEDELDTFATALDALREQYEPRGFNFELTGPWPAYSFSGSHDEHTEA